MVIDRPTHSDLLTLPVRQNDVTLSRCVGWQSGLNEAQQSACVAGVLIYFNDAGVIVLLQDNMAQLGSPIFLLISANPSSSRLFNSLASASLIIFLWKS